MTTLLEVRNLTRTFGALNAVAGVSFSVRQGELVGLIGPNGAGKSTLYNLIAGAIAPTSGGIGGGSALMWLSPTITDFTIVTVAGLPPGDQDALPYRIWIVNDTTGKKLGVGDPIQRLNADGGAMRVQNADDLAGFRSVMVADATGKVVLQGTIGSEAALASPAP